jgi:formylglycine-generating enzyme required for sulfatase activity
MLTKRAELAGLLMFVLFLLVLSCGKDNPESPNVDPVASFTVTPASGTADTLFHFDASSSSDAEDEVTALKVRWDWENDGTWDTQWSAMKTAGHQYGTAGTKTIKLSVKDTDGLTDDTTGTVTVVGPFETPEMVLVPAGIFMMGDGSAFCGTDQRQVTLTHSFYLGRYEVTNDEYRDALQWAYGNGHVTATSDSVNDNLDGSTALLVDLASSYCQISFSGGVFTVDPGKGSYPMVEVSWYGAVAYCDWISLAEGKTRAYDHSTWQCTGGNPYTTVGYRLPTDAEWEYATQYGGERLYPWGNEAPDCSRANCHVGGDCVGHASVVGSYPGAPAVVADSLYDMAGNVWEWCNDWHTCDLGTEPVVDPQGPASGTYRAQRGGSWERSFDDLLCASRVYDFPSLTDSHNGFRCARSQ